LYSFVFFILTVECKNNCRKTKKPLLGGADRGYWGFRAI